MKVLSYGELLLRLAAPGYTRLFQKDSFDATFCGGEANVAVSLAILGVDSAFVSKLPDNEIGKAAACSLRSFGVDVSKIVYGKGRMGLYYLEKGASQRPAKVIYDRSYSAIALSKVEDYDWNELFQNINWFHWTGINPALGGQLPQICLRGCQIAKEKGLVVSCDLNYRQNLWSCSEAQTIMKELMPYVDVCIANEEDAEKVLGITAPDTDISKGELSKEGYSYVAAEIARRYRCSYVAITMRESISANRNGWSALLYDNREEKTFFSHKYDIEVVDRIGGGDSFAAGIIYGLSQKMSAQDTVNFAAAASCLKHTMEGDFNRTTVEEVERLIKLGGNGRIQR